MNKLKLLDFAVLALYCAFIYWLSSQGGERPVPLSLTFKDKLHHAGAYFVMGLLAWRYFRYIITEPFLLLLVSAVFCSLYGATDEWHQSFVMGRNADILDWLADTIGAGLAMWMLYLIKLNPAEQNELKTKLNDTMCAVRHGCILCQRLLQRTFAGATTYLKQLCSKPFFERCFIASPETNSKNSFDLKRQLFLFAILGLALMKNGFKRITAKFEDFF